MDAPAVLSAGVVRASSDTSSDVVDDDSLLPLGDCPNFVVIFVFG
jgi:hypothetical protein